MKFSEYPSSYAPAKVLYEYLAAHKDSGIIKLDTSSFSVDSRGNCRVALRIKDASNEWVVLKIDTDIFNTPFDPKSDKFEGKPKIVINKYSPDCYEGDATERCLKPGTTEEHANPAYKLAKLLDEMIEKAIRKALEDKEIEPYSAASAKKRVPGVRPVKPMPPSKNVEYNTMVRGDGDLYPRFNITFNNKKWAPGGRGVVLKKMFDTPDGPVEAEILGTRVRDETDPDEPKVVEISDVNINQVVPARSTVVARVSIPRVTFSSKGVSSNTEVDSLTVIRGASKTDADQDIMPSIRDRMAAN